MTRLDLQDVLLICKRNNVFSPSCHLYGGLPGILDYGPIGAEIKRHLRRAWWEDVVYGDFSVHGIEAALLTPVALHEHSGFLGANYDKFGVFETAMKDEVGELKPCHLRVTTAQHSFANFDNIVAAHSPTLPFGIAQIGKAFRNEKDVTSFPVRMREFEQMELQYFVAKESANTWHEFWLQERLKWWEKQGISLNNLVIDDVPADELAHYSSKTYDINYKLKDNSFFEIEGIANRGDFDCGSHSSIQESLTLDSTVGKNTKSTALMAIKESENALYTAPYAIEPAAGVDRGLMAILLESFRIEQSSAKQRVVLSIRPHLAAFKACLYIPNNEDAAAISLARKIKIDIQKTAKGKIAIQIGGDPETIFSYHDEVGTPIIITLNDQLSSKDLIKARDRDTANTTQMTIQELHKRIQTLYM